MENSLRSDYRLVNNSGEIGTLRAVEVLAQIARELNARLVVVNVNRPEIVEPPAMRPDISSETRLLWGE